MNGHPEVVSYELQVNARLQAPPAIDAIERTLGCRVI